MKLQYRPAAIADLQKTPHNITETLKNPKAAASLRARILRNISLLRENPFMGTPLSSREDTPDTNVRYLVISRQMVFYEVLENRIEILRILDGRTNYLALLFD